MSGISGFDGIELEGHRITIGAGAKHRSVATHSALASRVPWLSEAASLIGDVQVRNRGTLGGNLCFADPRANLPPVLLSLHAHCRVSGQDGARELALDELFRGFRENTLGQSEILQTVEFSTEGLAGGAYLEIAPQLQGVPLVNVAVSLGSRPGVAVGGLAGTPLRLTAVESVLLAGDDERSVLAAYDACDFDPIVDLQAGARYRIKAGRALLARALRKAGRS